MIQNIKNVNSVKKYIITRCPEKYISTNQPVSFLVITWKD